MRLFTFHEFMQLQVAFSELNGEDFAAWGRGATCRACGQKIQDQERRRENRGPTTCRLTGGDLAEFITGTGWTQVSAVFFHYPWCKGPAKLTLPGVHLSLRAFEFLTKATTWYGASKAYSLPPGHLACPSPYKEHKSYGREDCCGVEDVRAMLLRQPVKVIWRSGVNFNRDYPLDQTMKAVKVTYPTCVTCLLVLDHALGTALPKSGRWVEAKPHSRDPRRWLLRWVYPAKEERRLKAVTPPAPAAVCSSVGCDREPTPGGGALCKSHYSRGF